jgi:hypothetical protein
MNSNFRCSELYFESLTDCMIAAEEDEAEMKVKVRMVHL